MKQTYKQLIEKIKQHYQPFLKDCSEILLIKNPSQTNKNTYCLTINHKGLEFRDQNKNIAITNLNYDSGIVQRNNQVIQNGMDFIKSIIHQVSSDLNKQQLQVLRRS